MSKVCLSCRKNTKDCTCDLILCRAVCGHCLRTFLSEIPKEFGLCWECGQPLMYIRGNYVLNENNIEGKKSESDI